MPNHKEGIFKRRAGHRIDESIHLTQGHRDSEWKLLGEVALGMIEKEDTDKKPLIFA